jgi:hypothetical protein
LELKPPVFSSRAPAGVGAVPAVRIARRLKYRPLSGRSTMRWLSTTWPRYEVSVCSSGADAATSTVSTISPTCSAASTRTRSCTFTVMFELTDFLKPADSTATEYVPTASGVTTKLPVESVVVFSAIPVP